MSQPPNVGSVTPTLRAKDLRAMKLGVPPRALVERPRSGITCYLAIEKCHLAIDKKNSISRYLKIYFRNSHLN